MCVHDWKVEFGQRFRGNTVGAIALAAVFILRLHYALVSSVLGNTVENRYENATEGERLALLDV